MSNFTEGKKLPWSNARRPIENPDNAVITRKCSYFLKSFVVETLSISVALFSAANLRLIFEDSLK